ncbi:MAG: glutamine synthetase family protein [Pseudomonadales bacterium]
MTANAPPDSSPSKAHAPTLAEKLASYAERGVNRAKIAFTDVDGVLRGKYISVDKLAALLREGGGWCDCVFGWDLDDVLYDQGTFTGWHSGFPDARYQLHVDTERWLADEHCPLFLASFSLAANPPPPCPRTLLAHSLERLKDAGLILKAGFEYEFFVFAETPESVREKGYRDLRPLTPGNFGYSVLRTGTHAELFTGLMDECEQLAVPLEGLHTETGPGVWEAALAPAQGLDAADRAALFKTFAKTYFARQGLLATFMAKWSMSVPGQSGHFHFSLLDATGNNQFRDDQDALGMSKLQRSALAGVLKLLPEWLPMVAPTINSYSRLVKGAWAPTAATWGMENRTTAVRVIEGSGQRLECRVPGADSNPYLVASAMTAAALTGIEQQLELTAATTGNAYEVETELPEALQFAGTLRQATQRFARSSAAREAFGADWVEHFVMTRDWECREYERNVNSWQLERYFELI